MYCLKMSPENETLWRDEYKNIRNDKRSLTQWLNDKIDITIEKAKLEPLEMYKAALSKGDWERARYWKDRMGGEKEADRFAWLDQMDQMGALWHEYVLHGW